MNSSFLPFSRILPDHLTHTHTHLPRLVSVGSVDRLQLRYQHPDNVDEKEDVQLCVCLFEEGISSAQVSGEEEEKVVISGGTIGRKVNRKAKMKR